LVWEVFEIVRAFPDTFRSGQAGRAIRYNLYPRKGNKGFSLLSLTQNQSDSKITKKKAISLEMAFF
jgi:hypothetical protein